MTAIGASSPSPARSRAGATVRQVGEPRVVLPVALLAIMSTVATVGFRAVFPGWTFVTTAVIGAIAAAAIVVVLRATRLGAVDQLVVLVVAFVLVGTAATAGLPTLEAFRTFGRGLVEGWARLLSSTAPADATPELRVLPFTIAWFGVVVGAELLRVRRAPGLAALGPVAMLVLAMLVTLERRSVALVQGAVMVVGALLLAGFQERAAARDRRIDDAATSAPRRLGALPAVGVAALVTAIAPVLGPRLPFADANERFDLRQLQTPPFDPLDEPSLLVQLKAGLQEEYADVVVFAVESDRRLDRFPLVTLDHYTNEVWAVADGASAASRFRPVDTNFPGPPELEADDGRDGEAVGGDTVGGTVGRTVEAVFTIEDVGRIARGEFSPVWLPAVGWPVRLEPDTPVDLRFGLDSGTLAVVPDGPPAGLTYRLRAIVPPELEDVALRSATVTLEEPLDLAVPQLRDVAADVLEGADQGWEQVEAIRSRFVDTGFYDSRATTATGRPGHNLGRLAEFVDDPERIVGFEEQYAAAAGLIARSAGLPTRVVVGYHIDEPDARWSDGRLEVRADDVSAWIEVRFDGIGWLPFDVTPPRDRQPEDTPVGRSEREVAIPNPPPDPPPPVPPPQLDREEEFEETEEEDDDEESDDDAGPSFWTTGRIVGTAIGVPVTLLLIAIVVVLVAKSQRRRRRRAAEIPARRVAGAWYEVIDRCEEAGAHPARHATSHEFARGLRDAGLVTDEEVRVLLALADDVDEATYHPDPPDPDRAEAAWAKSDEVVGSFASRRSWWTRWRHRLDPRPVMRKDPLMSVDGTTRG